MKTLVFPDGFRLEGFRWSMFGYWYRVFPDSGIREQQHNCLKYTNTAIRDAGITLVSEVS